MLNEYPGYTIALFVHIVHSNRSEIILITLGLVPFKIFSSYCLRESFHANIFSGLLIRDEQYI